MRSRILALAYLLFLALAGGVQAQSDGEPQPGPATVEAESAPALGYLEGTIRRIARDATGSGTALVETRDGRVLEATLPGPDPFTGEVLPPFEVGDRVEVYFSPDPRGGTSYVVVDWIRRPALLLLVATFLVVSVLVARLKGLRAFLATASSLALIILVIIPAIVSGQNAVLVSLLGVGGILFLAIYFVHGVNWSTTAALAGTFLATIVTMLLGILFSNLTHLTGLGSEDAAMIAASLPAVELRGLMLAGLLIGALGALTDITIVQASVVRELAHADPELSSMGLYRRGMNVGLDHIGSLVNTLVLAYTGAALPLLVLLGQGELGFARAVNVELIAAEVVHTLVGSIGLILAVPVTTLIATLMFRGGRFPIEAGERTHTHHHAH